MIPSQIYEVIHGGTQAAFIELLTQWGIWSRGKLCRGYPTGHHAQSCSITDDAALYLDQCIAPMRQRKKLWWRIFALHYVQGFDTLDIETLLKGKPRKGPRAGVIRTKDFYGVDLSRLDAKTALTEAEIRQLLQYAENTVFNNLLEKAQSKA